MRRIVPLLPLLVAALCSPSLPAAAAVPGTPLALTHFYALAVDGAHDRVFVTGGAGNDVVLVFDGSGAPLTTVTGVPGASGMAIVGDTLYVAASAGARIDTIDLAAPLPVKSGTIDLSSIFQTPRDVAFAGGRLWFSATVIGGGEEAGVVLPDGTGLQKAGALSGDRLASDTAAPDVLLAFDTGGYFVASYDVSTVPPTRARVYYTGDNVRDAALDGAGGRLVTASGSPYVFPEARLGDGALLQQYPANPYPTAVAVSAAGGGLLAGGANGIYDPDVFVYRLGTAQPTWTYDFGETSGTVLSRGLAWRADGSRLYVVAGDDYDGDFALYVLEPHATLLTLEASAASVTAGAPVTLTAQLTGGAPHRHVAIWAAAPAGGRTLVGEGTADASGAFTVTAHPAATSFFRAEHPGDDTWGPAAADASVTVPNSPRNAGVGPRLPFTAFYAIAVDAARGRSFVSGGLGNDGVLVVDADGLVTGRLAVPGASGMAVVGDELFVAAAGAARVDVVDLATEPLAVARSIELGPAFSRPTEIVHAGGMLWIRGVANAGGSGAAIVVSTAGTGVAAAGALEGTRFATSPDDPDALFTFVHSSSPATIYRYDASTVPATLQVRLFNPGGASNMRDLAVEAGGAYLVTASGAPYHFPEFRASDFAAFQQYAAGAYPIAVDTSAYDGGLIAGGIFAWYDPDLYVYRPGTAQPFWTYDFGTTSCTVADRGVAFGPDGRRLLVVAGDDNPRALSLFVFDPFYQPAQLTLAASPKTVTYGKATTLSVHLVGGESNHTVSVYAKPVGRAKRLLASGEVDGDGNFTIEVAPKTNTVYTAEYAGDATWGAAQSAPLSVGVRHAVSGVMFGGYGDSGGYRLYHRSQYVYYRAAVRPPHPGANVRIRLEAFVDGSWLRLGEQSFSLISDGSVSVYLDARDWPIGQRARFQTVMPADPQHKLGTSAWDYFMIMP